MSNKIQFQNKNKKMIHFVVLINRQGHPRLTKWFNSYSLKERERIMREITTLVLSRSPKMCAFVEWKNYKLVYKRYASLYFVFGVDKEENELLVLETIHHFVEVLDVYFGHVKELDLIFNFHRAYFILDEIVSGGEIQETSKKIILRTVSQQDALQEEGPYDPNKGYNFRY